MLAANPRPRSLRLVLGLAVGLLCAGGLAAGIWRLVTGALGSRQARPIAFVVSGDTAGWIVPCGCTSNQSGGLLRRGSYVHRLRGDAEVLVGDAGGAPAGTSAYQRAKFEAILRGELLMGLVAHNLGGPEAALGADYLRRVGAELGVPFVSANLRDEQGRSVAEPLRIVECGGRRLAVAGVLAPRYVHGGLTAGDPRTALLDALAAAQGHYDALVVLAYLPEDELRDLAAALPEADAVIGGPTGQSITPRPVGVTVLAAATNKGKFLVELQAAGNSGRLAWQGKVVEMGPELQDDPEQQANLRGYLGELARRDFPADQTGLAPSPPAAAPAEYRLAGDQACAACHREDCKVWQATRHAHAWQTIRERGQQVDPFCQQCHTTGYGLPGGFASIAHSAEAVAVRCESCHGPALVHTRRPETRTPFAARGQCLRCHDPENSPKFDYARYWPQIRHGARAAGDARAQR